MLPPFLSALSPVIRFLPVFVALVVLSGPVFAEEAQPPVPEPIQNMVTNGAQIRYLGREAGLDGWIVLKNGQEQYFYSTPDGQGIVMGVLFNNKGDTLTLRQINALRKKEGPAIDRLAGYPDPLKKGEDSTSSTAASTTTPDFNNPQALIKSVVKSKSEQLYDGVQAANTITIGSANAPAIYIFIDPECPHCHDLIQDFRKSGYLEQGLVQLRLIPVGVLSEESITEAAYLLASPHPEKDLYRHLDGEKNALLADKSVNTQGVQKNIQLMQDWDLSVTPFSVYRSKDGKVRIMEGRPDNLKKVITELR